MSTRKVSGSGGPLGNPGGTVYKKPVVAKKAFGPKTAKSKTPPVIAAPKKNVIKINSNPVKVKPKAKPVNSSVKVTGKQVIKIKSNNL